MGKGVSGLRPPRFSWCSALAWPRCRSRSFSFALVVVRVLHRSRSLSFVLVIAHARCRPRPLSFALVVVRVRYRSRSLLSTFVVVRCSFFHGVVTWEVPAANRKWGVYGDGVASVEWVSIKLVRVLTVCIKCKTMTTTTKLSSSSSSLPRHSLVHRYGAVGCAAGGRWWVSWSLVVVWKSLWPLRVVVVIVRRSWAFVERLSSFLGG